MKTFYTSPEVEIIDLMVGQSILETSAPDYIPGWDLDFSNE